MWPVAAAARSQQKDGEMSPHTRPRALFSAHPESSGLYRREFEHDACGVAMIATMATPQASCSWSAR